MHVRVRNEEKKKDICTNYLSLIIVRIYEFATHCIVNTFTMTTMVMVILLYIEYIYIMIAIRSSVFHFFYTISTDKPIERISKSQRYESGNWVFHGRTIWFLCVLCMHPLRESFTSFSSVLSIFLSSFDHPSNVNTSETISIFQPI